MTPTAAITAALLLKMTRTARRAILADLRSEPAARRALLAEANARLGWTGTDTAATRTTGELTIAPTRGGWTVTHTETGMVLDTRGCWMSQDEAYQIYLSGIGEEQITWGDAALAEDAALASL